MATFLSLRLRTRLCHWSYIRQLNTKPSQALPTRVQVHEKPSQQECTDLTSIPSKADLDALLVRKTNGELVTPVSTTTKVQDMQWIPPAPKLSKEQKEYLAEYEWVRKLPEPPAHTFSSFSKEDRLAERIFIKRLDEILPPRDIFRVPVACSKPWFTYVLWTYCFLVGAAAVLLGNWDGLNEGHEHVFSGVQKRFWTWYAAQWQISDSEEQQAITDRLHQALLLETHGPQTNE